jgi:hypothetical protein
MGQFKALLTKNWLLYKRGIIGNVLEIVVPVLFVTFIILAKQLDPIVEYAEQSFLSNATYAKTISSDSSASAYLK